MSSESEADGTTALSAALSHPQAGVATAGMARPPLTDRVAGAIRDMIIQDEFKAGERIRERHLAARLSVSRTLLREALKVLASEGLVELLPNRGAVVSDPEPGTIHDLLQVLGVLEGLGGELAARNARDEEIAEIRALHFEMLAAYAREDRLQYFKLNQGIHRAIIEASRNPALVETHGRINAQLYRVRYRSNLRNQKWHTAIEEHERILAALLGRDGDRLARELRSHLGSVTATLRHGVEHLLRDAGVTIVAGTARFMRHDRVIFTGLC